MVRTFFGHGSNAMLACATLALAGAAKAGGPKIRALPVALGTVLFFASEYASHRYLLHAKPASNAVVHGLQRRLHYDHHVEPARLDLLFLPPWALGPVLAAFTALYAATTRDRDATASLLLGNLLGLQYYEWVHYVAHIPYKPRTPLGRYMKKYHLWHHFKNERLWYGVTNPGMDRVVGTYAVVTDVERSASTRVLYN